MSKKYDLPSPKNFNYNTQLRRPSLFEHTRHRINHVNDDTFSDRAVTAISRPTAVDRKTFFNIVMLSYDFIISWPDDFNIETILLFFCINGDK